VQGRCSEILPLTILNLASQIDRQCIDRRDGGVPYDTAVLMARMELNEVVSKGVETWRKSVFCPEKIKLLESLTNYREGRTLPSLIRDARPLMMRTIKAERTIVALAQEITKQ